MDFVLAFFFRSGSTGGRNEGRGLGEVEPTHRFRIVGIRLPASTWGLVNGRASGARHLLSFFRLSQIILPAAQAASFFFLSLFYVFSTHHR